MVCIWWRRNFGGQDPAISVGTGQEVLRQDRLQIIRKLVLNVVLLLRGENAVDALDRLHGVGGMQRRQH
jgi:hypothetical protein